MPTKPNKSNDQIGTLKQKERLREQGFDEVDLLQDIFVGIVVYKRSKSIQLLFYF